MRSDGESSNIKEIKPKAPQGSVLWTVLYLLYTGDTPASESADTFAYDTSILVVDKSTAIKTKKFQTDGS